jgi:hypothetical protein
MIRISTFTLIGVTIMATTTVAAGQSQTPAPTDPTLAALQLQQQQLAAQQAALDARVKMQQDQQALLTGSLPASSAAPQSGAFTVTGTNPFDSQKLAYDALSKVAGKVAAKVAVTGPVLVYDQTEINSLVNYKSVLKVLTAVQTEVRQLKGTFSNQMDPEAQTLLRLPAANAAPGGAKNFAGILAPGLALGGLKTLSDLIGMFRTNTSIAFSTFTSDDVALAAAVTEALIAKNASVYQPAVMPLDATDNASAFMDLLSQVQSDLVNLQNDATTDQSKVQQVSDALGAFIQADQALQANTDQTKAAGLTSAREVARVFALGLLGGTAAAALDAPTANIWKAQRDQFLKELATLVSSVTTMTTSFGTLQTSLTAVTNTGSATLTAILRAEKLMAKATTANASILLVKTSVLGGSVVTRTNLFTGGHLLYTGGAIVNFTLFDATGLVKASGVVVGDTETKKTDF